MSWIRRIADHSEKDSLASRFRQRRFARFRALVNEISGPVRILDVGGTEQFWHDMNFPSAENIHITLLNVEKVPVSMDVFYSVSGDAANMSCFADNEFDIVFSNSTIEHLGSWQNQQNMAAEVQRISERYFIQTPNRYFPIEPHFLFPFFQFLPQSIQVQIALHWTTGWYSKKGDPVAARREVEAIRLLTAKELSTLFPDVVLYREKWLGWTKSFIAYHGSDTEG